MKQRSGHLQGFQARDERGRAVPCAFCMCQTAGQQPPGRACWWVSGCRGSTRRGGLWPRLLRLQRKKKIICFFLSRLRSYRAVLQKYVLVLHRAR